MSLRPPPWRHIPHHGGATLCTSWLWSTRTTWPAQAAAVRRFHREHTVPIANSNHTQLVLVGSVNAPLMSKRFPFPVGIQPAEQLQTANLARARGLRACRAASHQPLARAGFAGDQYRLKWGATRRTREKTSHDWAAAIMPWNWLA